MRILKNFGAVIAIGIIGSLLVVGWTIAALIAISIAIISGLIQLLCSKKS